MCTFPIVVSKVLLNFSANRSPTCSEWRKATPRPAYIAWKWTGSALSSPATCAPGCRKSVRWKLYSKAPILLYNYKDKASFLCAVCLDWKVFPSCPGEGKVSSWWGAIPAFPRGVCICQRVRLSSTDIFIPFWTKQFAWMKTFRYFFQVLWQHRSVPESGSAEADAT